MPLPVAAKLLIPAAVIGLVALSGKKPAAAKPSTPAKPGADAVPPPDLLAKIQAAFTAADPAQLRQLADEVEKAGFKAQADDLRAFAKKVEDAIKQAPVSKPPASPTLPPTPSNPGQLPPVSPLPGIVPPLAKPGSVTTLPEVVITATPGLSDPLPTPAAQQQKLLAGKVALMLRNTAKGKEDKGLVMAFQQQELDAGHGPGGAFGATPSKADGLYGPKSALQLARFYGIVPPKPFYWAKNTWLNDKKNYRAEMARFAAVDPQRADEWSQAGKVL